MDSLSTTFVGIIALALVIQAACTVYAGIAALRAAAGLGRWLERADAAMAGPDPALVRLGRQAAWLASGSENAVARARQVEAKTTRALAACHAVFVRLQSDFVRLASAWLGPEGRAAAARTSPGAGGLGRPRERWREEQAAAEIR